MRSQTHPIGWGRAESHALECGLVLLSLALSGCASGMYRAAELPPELHAPPPINMHTLKLSTLTGAATSHTVIGPGDALEVTIVSGYDQEEVTPWVVRVAEDGVITLPIVGELPVAGLEPEQAERRITSEAIHRNLYRQPLVTVTMKEPRVNKITVVGAVNEPGVYELPRGSSTMLAAIVQAGGLSDNAGSTVEIVRQSEGPPARRTAAASDGYRTVSHASAQPTPESIRLDLQSLAETGGAGIPLMEGDVVEVETRDLQPVHVMGLVRKAGAFELPMHKEMRVLDALALAGERTVPWADKVVIVRQVPQRPEPIVIAVSIREAMHNGDANVRLAPGDVVSVEQSAATRAYDVLNFVRVGISGSAALF